MTAKNEVDDIVQINPLEGAKFEVLYTFRETYTALGLDVTRVSAEANQPWTPNGTKFRGRAKIRYDDFLKKFILTDLERSRWDEENGGRPRGRWSRPVET